MLLKESEERWRVRGEMDEWWCWVERYASVGRLSRMYLSSTSHHSTLPLRIMSISNYTKNHIFFTLGFIFIALDFIITTLFFDLLILHLKRYSFRYVLHPFPCLSKWDGPKMWLSLVEDPKPENKTQTFFTSDLYFDQHLSWFEDSQMCRTLCQTLLTPSDIRSPLTHSGDLLPCSQVSFN